MTHTAVLAFGGNLPSERGTPMETQGAALKEFEAAGVIVKAVSSLYQTTPVPPSGQPDFINCALLIETGLSADDLLALCHQIEKRLGRQRGERWAARTLDIDLLTYDDMVLPSVAAWLEIASHENPSHYIEAPMVPHPRLHLRGFVLAPMKDIAPDWLHPITGKTIGEMYDEMEAAGGLAGITRLSVRLPGLPALQRELGHV